MVPHWSSAQLFGADGRQRQRQQSRITSRKVATAAAVSSFEKGGKRDGRKGSNTYFIMHSGRNKN